MNAAIDAANSTEQNGVNEEEKSVTRQIDHPNATPVSAGRSVNHESRPLCPVFV